MTIDIIPTDKIWENIKDQSIYAIRSAHGKATLKMAKSLTITQVLKEIENGSQFIRINGKLLGDEADE